MMGESEHMDIHDAGPRKSLDEMLDEAAHKLDKAIDGSKPQIGVVLGSGLGGFAEQIEDAITVPFADVPFMRKSTAAGHVGRFVAGEVEGMRVIAMQGRLHGYEGYTSQEVAFPIWLMRRLGTETLITTNAAGAINEAYHVGDFCVMADHINLTGRNPLVGQDANAFAPRFISLYEAYDPRLRALALDAARRLGIAAHEGTYLGLLGPSFETPAEIRAFRTLGADTVAMSVVEEVIAARHVGMRVLGISLCTNMACGIEGANPDDDEVRDVGEWKATDFDRLMRGIIVGIKGIA